MRVEVIEVSVTAKIALLSLAGRPPRDGSDDLARKP
jgi:hypothetical protein